MIRIVKPAPPAVLLTKGADAARELCEAYEAAPRDYQSGEKTFDFDSSIYAATEVKELLRSAQHNKCAFCESVFTHTGYGDVEHSRPKAGYKQKDGDDLKRPGYYWLAYEWANLFYSCQLCNQRFKRNLFPLKDGRRRARTHRHDLRNEKPLLVDPSTQNPARYIGFREEYAYPIKGRKEGEVTIEVFGLNREELAEVRRERLATLRDLLLGCALLRERIAENADPDLEEQLRVLEVRLDRRKAAEAEYAAMNRAFLDL